MGSRAFAEETAGSERYVSYYCMLSQCRDPGHLYILMHKLYICEKQIVNYVNEFRYDKFKHVHSQTVTK